MNRETTKERIQHGDAMRVRSGSVDSEGALIAFLYTLLRDDVTPGRIEEIMVDVQSVGITEFSNGWLARYAEDIAARLVGKGPA